MPRDPVIVTGPPRSGVCLLAALLDAHPALASGPDLPSISSIARQWHDIDATLGSNIARNYGVSRDASREFFRAAALALLEQRLAEAGKQRFVLPSFSAALLMDTFARLFPQAQFVLTMREPAGIARSLLRCNWVDGREGERLPYVRDAKAAARFVSDFIALAKQGSERTRSGDRVLTMSYERLCARPVQAMERLGRFLGIPPPKPFIEEASARLVTQTRDNRHPPLRTGPIRSGHL